MVSIPTSAKRLWRPRNVIVTACLLAVAIGIGTHLLRRGVLPAEASRGQPSAVPVTVAAAARRDVPIQLTGLGTVQATFTVGVSDGFDPVTVSLTESCPAPVAGTEQIPIDGGCVTYRSTVTGPFVASFAPNGGLEFTSRADLVAAVAAEDDQVLCGALAPPCP